jgi:hypothetical protein
VRKRPTRGRSWYRFLYFYSVLRSFGPMSAQTAKKLTQTLTSELPLITGMARPRQNALRLPSAAKPCELLLVQIVFGLFKKKSQMARRDFLRAGPERRSRWSMVGWSTGTRMVVVDVAIAHHGRCDSRWLRAVGVVRAARAPRAV